MTQAKISLENWLFLSDCELVVDASHKLNSPVFRSNKFRYYEVQINADFGENEYCMLVKCKTTDQCTNKIVRSGESLLHAAFTATEQLANTGVNIPLPKVKPEELKNLPELTDQEKAELILSIVDNSKAEPIANKTPEFIKEFLREDFSIINYSHEINS